MMDKIDRLLSNFSKEIEVVTVSDPKIFVVRFGAFPSQETLSPLLRLFESKRFKWNTYGKNLEPEKTLLFDVEVINVIPASDAILTLTEVWTDMGYTVTVKHEDRKGISMGKGGALDKG
jgi:hypothetical protein